MIFILIALFLCRASVVVVDIEEYNIMMPVLLMIVGSDDDDVMDDPTPVSPSCHPDMIVSIIIHKVLFPHPTIRITIVSSYTNLVRITD
ncbi:hypothetical protein DFA_10185 [Cavenderia fasciculata]|uniref:Secreted protein n=1 Tax=Cavenderia fasciculata TaxID=261658 RepID=F4Q9I2_CACFS|nr:uncharacterized protein DFA_10185 [Cavenderia fasciculata]EGG15351.1 hypothetical protein DFA_10185 [Cavenderia fasciculata]|eukprot:XP_004354093.1 hypothetical protein DFA_10185 [Cavenderia fasciculata]